MYAIGNDTVVHVCAIRCLDDNSTVVNGWRGIYPNMHIINAFLTCRFGVVAFNEFLR